MSKYFDGKIEDVEILDHQATTSETILLWKLGEARYWARRMKAERDENWDAFYGTACELDEVNNIRYALQKDLDRIANPTVEILRSEFSLSQPPGGVLGFWLQGFTQLFIDQGAENYIEILLGNAANADNPTEYIFHIQKREGKTPHELRQEAEKECAALQAKLDEAREALNKLAHPFATINDSEAQVVEWVLSIVVPAIARLDEGAKNE